VSQAVILIPSLHPDDKLGTYVNALIASGFERIVVVDDGSGAPRCFAYPLQPPAETVGRH